MLDFYTGVIAAIGIIAVLVLKSLLKPRWDVKGKVIVITGGSSGIGAEAAKVLAKSQARLVIAARRQEELDRVVAECQKLGGQAIGVRADVGVEADCKAIVDQAVKQFGQIDALVLNAGISMSDLFEDIKAVKLMFDSIMQTNFYQVLHLCHYALPHLKKSKGRIVGVSTLAAFASLPSRTAYVASKCAMDGFLSVLRTELKASGVTVTMVFPGVVSTEINRTRIGPDGKTGTAETELDLAQGIPAPVAGQKLVNALVTGVRDDYWTGLGSWAPVIKGLIPGFVDNLAIKQYKAMTKQKVH